jgi:surfeit locus 1 family protein
VLTSQRGQGPGYRADRALFETERAARDGRPGFSAAVAEGCGAGLWRGPVTGNLHWPDEIDPWFTPDPDLARNIWFARDVPAMARVLETDPVLVVARQTVGGRPA